MSDKKVNRGTAIKTAIPIITALNNFGRVKVCGSLRRRIGRVKDIDIIGSNPDMMVEFLKLGDSIVIGKPDSKRGSIMKNNIQVDLWIIPKISWGTGMAFATGSMQENIWLRGIAKRKGYALNQYGLFYNGYNFMEGKPEKEIYSILGVDYRLPKERLGWLK